ncbi:MAG: efflux RND transporter periplasmic adaptor subunit [Planctomycetaceae bacterium]|nr:efflux RND transporter periplasmic adaptor subunit [Planctomycetaceae bacterium]
MKVGIWILGLALVGGGLFFARGTLFGGQGAQVAIEGAKVRRGPLRINVIERGNLRAAKNVELVSELEGNSTILYLIPEGTRVEKGTLVAELDATALVEKRVTQEISVQNAEGAFVKARQNLEIQRSQNVSDVALAERTLDFARRDQLKYLEGDWPQQLQAAEDAILLAEEDLKRAEDQLKWSKDLAAQGFLTRTELEADELAFKRAEIKVEQTKREKVLAAEFDFPRESRRLEADVEEAVRELARVNLQAEARLVDYEADLRTSKTRLDLENEKLARYAEQIERAKIYAPVSGMVVYAQERGNRWGSSESAIAEGVTVRERQSIITIPASDAMIAQASLHESKLEQVQEGQRVIVRVDALPDREFQGRVESKAVLPDQNSWMANPNLRVYRCDIEILDTDLRMRPGMSCSLEVVVEDLVDVLYVPVQAVFLDAGQRVVFVSGPTGPEMRPVEVGRHNPAWVEIRSGLSEGETVLLAQPEGFRLRSALAEEPEPAAEEAPPLGGGAAPGERSGRSMNGAGAEGAGPGAGARGERGAGRGDGAGRSEGGAPRAAPGGAPGASGTPREGRPAGTQG